MKINIVQVISEFERININYPYCAGSESLYQVMGYMGNIIQTAHRESIQIDDNIFNEVQYPYETGNVSRL